MPNQTKVLKKTFYSQPLNMILSGLWTDTSTVPVFYSSVMPLFTGKQK
jgi:hypothetical protein